MTNDEKQQLMAFVKEHLDWSAKEIQLVMGGSLSTIKKYIRIAIKKELKQDD